ncbi:glycosyltransferase [Candidatus Woesearchaeota archaeon]|nr:glycosyltransferase [Candidatus Woesearchaeota archaeon]
MATISVCMIVKNEEKVLERCLNSVKSLANEIIIVDTGSTDKTKEIAKKFTDNIFDFEWVNDFSAARNFSLKHATCDWILVLDADEMIAEQEIDMIKELVENKDAVAYYLNQTDYVKVDETNRFGITGSYKEVEDLMPFISKPITRLFRNRKGISYRNKIHEVVEPSIEEKNLEIINTNIQILHMIFEQEGGFGPEKLQKYLDLGFEQIKRTPENPKAYSDVGKLYLVKRDLETAKKYIVKAIEVNNEDSDSYFVLGRIYEWKNMLDDAIKCYRMSVKFNPNKIEAYVGLGTLLMKKREFEKAIMVYEKSVEKKIWNVFIVNNLAYLYSVTNNVPKAIALYEQILDSNMRMTDALKVKIINNLVQCYLNLELYEKSINLLKKSRQEMPKELSFHNNLIKVYDYLKRTDEMIEAMEELDKIKKG